MKEKDIKFEDKIQELEKITKELESDELTLDDSIENANDEYDEITSKRGIYEYVLSGNEKCLSIRAFKDKEKRKVYERQKGICPKCKRHFDIDEMQVDHIKPWNKGGKTNSDNCQVLCKKHNRSKSDI